MNFRTILSGLLLTASLAYAQSDTTFTYQGQLQESGQPANGSFGINFALYDSDQVTGNQIGNIISIPAVNVTDGLFSVQLDFGAEAFDGRPLWLDMEIDQHLMWPRTPINPAPYAIQTRGIFVDDSERVGIGTTSPQHELDIEGLAPVVRITATNPNVTAFPSLAFKGSAGSPIFQSMGRINFFDELDTHRAMIAANKSGPTASSILLSTTPSELSQLSIFSTAARVAGGLQLQRRVDAEIVGELNTDGSDSFLKLEGTDLAIETQGGGRVVIGDAATEHIVIDENEINAQLNSSTWSTLRLNPNGGPVTMGQHGILPAYAYGAADAVGTLLSSSSNVLSCTRIERGLYQIEVQGGIEGTDIVILTAQYLAIASSTTASGSLYIRTVAITTNNDTDSSIDFVIYRP